MDGGTMTDATAEFFGALAERGHVPLLEKAKGTVRFELADGKNVDRWLLSVDHGDLNVSHKAGGADCTLRAGKDVFDGIAAGRVNAFAAVLRGEVTVEGDMELMTQFQKVLPGPPPKRSRSGNGGKRRRQR